MRCRTCVRRNHTPACRRSNSCRGEVCTSPVHLPRHTFVRERRRNTRRHCRSPPRSLRTESPQDKCGACRPSCLGCRSMNCNLASPVPPLAHTADRFGHCRLQQRFLFRPYRSRQRRSRQRRSCRRHSLSRQHCSRRQRHCPYLPRRPARTHRYPSPCPSTHRGRRTARRCPPSRLFGNACRQYDTRTTQAPA